MNQVLHILHYRLVAGIAEARQWTSETALKRSASFLVFGGFALATYAASRISTEYLLGNARLGLFLLHRFLAMLLFVFFLSLTVGNLIVAFASLYRSREMSFFLSKPLSFRSLFTSKFLDSFFYSSTAFFLVAFAVLLGYGVTFTLPWYTYVYVMVFQLIPFMLAAACVAVFLLMVLMRYVEIVGVKRMIGFLLVIYLVVLYGYFAATNPVALVESVKHHYPLMDLHYRWYDPWFTRFLPNYWIADGFYWQARGWSGEMFLPSLGMSLTALVALAGTVLSSGILFYPGWNAAQALRDRRSVSNGKSPFFSLLEPSRMDSQVAALVKKEIWQFLREPSQWMHLGILIILVATFAVSIAQINLRQTIPFLQSISYTVLLLFNAFLIASVALRFVFPLISVEGENFWSVLCAPVRRESVFWMKFLIAFLPVLFLAEILVLVSHTSLLRAKALVGTAMISMLGVSLAMVAVNLGAGSYFADFREKNPLRAASSQSATLTFLLCVAYLAVVVALLFMPSLRYFEHILWGTPYRTSILWVAGLEVLGLSVTVALISLAVGRRALARDVP